MLPTTETSARERCAEHDLAVGPAGECVLCRRARARVGNARPRWLGPALLAASLGTLLLGGAALARTRPSTGAPPAQEPVMGEMPHHPVSAPLEVRAPAPVPEAPHEVVTAHAPAPTPPAAPPRNYLDEAYAAMPKGNLYDEAVTPHATTTAPGCPCQKTGCQRQYLLAYGGRVPATGSRVSGTPTVQVQVQQTVAPAPLVQYGHASGSLSRGVSIRH